MNRSIKHISIPQPCTQNWGDMDVADQGRFCQSCQKNVVDFTGLTYNQIIEALSSSGNTCGRFADGQLESLNLSLTIQSKTSLFSWNKFSLAAAFIGFVPFIKAEAKIKPPIEYRPLVKKPVTEVIDSTKEFRTITGLITDSLKQPLGGSMLRIKGTQFGTQADSHGYFSLSIPSSSNLIGQVLFIGFKTQEFKIDDHTSNYTFVLKETNQTMGEVVIVGYSKPVPAKPVKKN